MRSNRILLVGIFFLIIILSTLLFLSSDPTSAKTRVISLHSDILVDMTNSVGTIGMIYGANENDNWEDFAYDEEPKAFHTDVGSELIRVWAASPIWRTSTVPLKEDGIYDFSALDDFVGAVLAINATPFMVFAHEPGTVGKAYDERPPENIAIFVDYIGTVVSHYDEECRKGHFTSPCDIDDWYFEIWNEPENDIWWKSTAPLYPELFNAASKRIKEISSDAKVGGFSLPVVDPEGRKRLKAFASRSTPDFFSFHHFGNAIDSEADEAEKMASISHMFSGTIVEARKLLDKQGLHAVELINSEYNSDSREEFMNTLDDQFTAAWYASALIWQIESDEVTAELFYSGTSLQSDGGFGMWSKDRDGRYGTWPVYDMKKWFVRLNKQGSTILYSWSYSPGIDLLAVRNGNDVYITIVNKKDASNKVAATIIGALSIKDVVSGKSYTTHDDMVDVWLEPYDIRFFKIS